MKIQTIRSNLKVVIQMIWKDMKRIRVALLILLVYGVVTQIVFHTVCPFVILTGMPCPACGLTRAFIQLIQGNFAQAMQMNAMIILWIGLILYLFNGRYIMKKRPRYRSLMVILTCIATLAYYIYRMKMMYPDTYPLSYTHENILEMLDETLRKK